MPGELVKMSDQFQGLPMDTLIGGPLTAASDAQVKLARATADFIKVIGFLPPSNGDDGSVGDTRTATFKFKRPVEQAGGAEGSLPQISEEEVELEVPLLSIVNVPNLSVSTVDISFDMEVKSSFETKSSIDAEAGFKFGAQAGYGIWSAKVAVQGKVSAHKENTRKSDNSAKYHISVHAEDKGTPEALARVMDILQTSVAPRTVKQLPQSTGTTG